MSIVRVAAWLLLLFAADPAPPADPTLPPDPNASRTTAGVSVTLRDIPLDQLLERLNIQIGYKLSGKITVKANLSVPVSDATSTKAYVVRGKITSPALALEGLELKDFAAEIVYADGRLKLTSVKGTLPPDTAAGKPGELSGTATAAIEPRGDLTADLTLGSLPLGQLLKAIPGGGLTGSGGVSGKLTFTAPVDTISDPAKWVASGDLTAPAITLAGRSGKDVAVKLAVKDGVAKLTDVAATVEGIPITVEGKMTLSDKYAFTAAVRTKPSAVAELQKLVPELEIPVAIKGKLESDSTAEGTLSPTAVSAAGTLTLADLAVGDTPADKLTVKYKLTPERFQVPELAGGIFGGKLNGSADIPLAADKKGEFKLAFQEIDAKAIAEAVPTLPVRLTGKITGGFAGTVPAAKANEARGVNADLTIEKAPGLTVATDFLRKTPIDGLTGKVSLVNGAMRYDLEGKFLGGSFEIKPVDEKGGADKPPANKPPAVPPKLGQNAPPDGARSGLISLRGIDLAKVAEAFKLKNFPLAGRFDLTFAYNADLSDGGGRYSVRGLSYGTSQLVPELTGTLRLRDGNLELGDTAGPLAGGTVRARVRASLSEPQRNFFRLNLDRADLGRLSEAFTGKPNLLEGGVSLTARGKFYPEFTASGAIGLGRGQLAGLSTSDLQVPFALTLRGGGGQVAFRDISGTVGNGRVTGQFEVGFGTVGRVQGQLRFVNVRLGNVLSDYKQANYFANARATGRIDLKGENVRSLDDLSGTAVATLGGAALRDVPVVSAVTPFVSPTAVAKPFESGDFRASLSRGVLRIERLTLTNSNTDVYGDGMVGVTSGRLDLGVIVRTGNLGVNDVFLNKAGLALPAFVGPIPVGLVVDISAFLSNQTVRLNITGTVANPNTQVNTTRLLGDEAIRFLLRRYVPIAAATLPQVTPRSNR